MNTIQPPTNNTSRWLYEWKVDRVLCRYNEPCPPYMDPLAFAEVNGLTISEVSNHVGISNPKEFVLGLLQFRFKVILESFLNSHDLGLDNGEESQSGGIPVSRIDSNLLLIYITQLQDLGLSKIKPIVDAIRNITVNSKEVPINEVATLLALFYRWLPLAIEEVGAILQETKLSNPGHLDVDSYLAEDTEYRQTIIDLKNYVHNHLEWAFSAFYIHGSMATLDYVKGCSDLDTFAVVKFDVCSDENKLLLLREKLLEVWKFIYRVDPLQHHGVMLISEQDTRFYSQAWFPFVILKHAKSIIHSESLIFLERDASFDQKHAFSQVVHYFRYHYYMKSKFDTIFTRKYFLQTALLFPSLYFQAKGQYVYKKNSFPLLYGEYSEDILQCITTISSIRANNLYLDLETISDNFIERDGETAKEWVCRFHRTVHSIKPSEQLLSFTDDITYQLYNFALTLYKSIFGSIYSEIIDGKFRFINPPRLYAMNNYNRAIKKVMSEITQLTSVNFVQFGSMRHLGISDIDLLIVIHDKSVPVQLNRVPQLWDTLDEETKYLFYHDPPMIIHSDLLPQMGKLYPIFQADFIEGESFASRPLHIEYSQELQLLSLVEISCLYFFRDTILSLFTKVYDIRFLLLRLSGIQHSIRILEDDLSSENYIAFNRKVRELREQWFIETDENNKDKLINLVVDAVSIQLEIIEVLRRKLSMYINTIHDDQQQVIVAALDNEMFFVTNWSMEKCLASMEKLYQTTGRLIIELPAEFASLLAYYHKNGGLFGKCLDNRFISGIELSNIWVSDIVEDRRKIMEQQIQSLQSQGVNWGSLPHWGFKLNDITVINIPWKEQVINSKLLNNIEMDIDQYLVLSESRGMFSIQIRGLIESANFDKSIELLEPFLDKNPYDAELQYLLGYSLHMQKANLHNAIEHYSLALDYGFDAFWVRYNLAALYFYDLEQLEEAMNEIVIAVELNHNHSDALSLHNQIKMKGNSEIKHHITEIRSLLDQGNYQGSYSIFENNKDEILKYGGVDAHYIFAFLLHMLKINLEEARHQYTIALEQGFDPFWVLYNRADLLINMDQPIDAYEDLKQALKIDPDHADANILYQNLKENLEREH